VNTPRPWREIKLGQGPSDDIRAVGRMLRGLLGEASTNSGWKTGNYADQFAADVARARSKLGLSGDRNSVGATLFAALYPYVDAYGETLNARQPSAVTSPTPTCKRLPLSKGMSGKDIQGAQRALWRALQGDSTNARNGSFGDQTVSDIGKFRERYAVSKGSSNAQIGAELWAVLTRWMDQTAVDLVHAQPPPAPPAPAPSDLRAKIVNACEWAYQNRSGFLYAQVRPMPTALRNPPTKRTDCSGYATLAYQDAGAPNPNRSDGVYDGYGYTGTLASCGRKVSTPKPGDLAMYGSGTYSHVAICDNSGGVYSFGSDPIKHYDTAKYRSDFACYIRSNHFTD
jgi:hypothetical protein